MKIGENLMNINSNSIFRRNYIILKQLEKIKPYCYKILQRILGFISSKIAILKNYLIEINNILIKDIKVFNEIY